jgi:CubicO group peptidase (beta-lactamase class C family)
MKTDPVQFQSNLMIPIISSLVYSKTSENLVLTTDKEIKKMLIDWVDIQPKYEVIVVRILTPQGRNFIPSAEMNSIDFNRLVSNTVFEIRLVTTVFTALLFSDVFKEGKIALADPVQRYLLEGMKKSNFNGHPITLVDLVTQTSCMQFWSDDVSPSAEGINIMRKYTHVPINQLISTFKVHHKPGTKWKYLNLGFGLLGRTCAHFAVKDFMQFVYDGLTKPFGMRSTSILVTSQMKENPNVVHNTEPKVALKWNLTLYSRAGPLRSTANDFSFFFLPLLVIPGLLYHQLGWQTSCQWISISFGMQGRYSW